MIFSFWKKICFNFYFTKTVFGRILISFRKKKFYFSLFLFHFPQRTFVISPFYFANIIFIIISTPAQCPQNSTVLFKFSSSFTKISLHTTDFSATFHSGKLKNKRLVTVYTTRKITIISRVRPIPCRCQIHDTIGHIYADTDTGLYKFFVLKCDFVRDIGVCRLNMYAG